MTARTGPLSPNTSPKREPHRHVRARVTEARATLDGMETGPAGTEIRSPVDGLVLPAAGILLIAFPLSANIGMIVGCFPARKAPIGGGDDRRKLLTGIAMQDFGGRDRYRSHRYRKFTTWRFT